MTWEELEKKISKLTDEQKKQPVQIYKSENDSEKIIPLMEAVCLDTLYDLEVEYARSCYDNKFHGTDFVLLVDNNPFTEDGCTSYELKINKKDMGDWTFVPRDYPFGKTTKEDQTNKQLRFIYENDISNYKYKILETKMNNFEDNANNLERKNK